MRCFTFNYISKLETMSIDVHVHFSNGIEDGKLSQMWKAFDKGIKRRQQILL